jgi:hypothetical protein
MLQLGRYAFRSSNLQTVARSKNLASVVTSLDFDFPLKQTPVRFQSTTTTPEKKQSFLNKIWGVDSCTASPEYTNRWTMIVPAFLTHMSIGTLLTSHPLFTLL